MLTSTGLSDQRRSVMFDGELGREMPHHAVAALHSRRRLNDVLSQGEERQDCS